VKVNTNDLDFPGGLVLTSDTHGQGHNPSSVVVPASGSARGDTGYLRSSPTLASILSVTAQAAAGVVTVRWVTVAEVGTVAYDLQRQLADGTWLTVNADPVFALNSIIGGAYAVGDPGARAQQTYNYQLAEYLENGDTKLHGPFAVTVTCTRGVPVALVASALEDGSLHLTWPGEAGANYSLERSFSLGDGADWLAVPLPAPDATHAVLPMEGASGFFRVFRLDSAAPPE
jgi:hypothetical protein